MPSNRRHVTRTYYQRKLRRLSKEILRINEIFYNYDSSNPEETYHMLEHHRDDVVRAIVLQLHTAIEDMLDLALKGRLLGLPTRALNRPDVRRRMASRQLDLLLKGGRAIGFDHKLTLMRGLGLLQQSICKQLVDLNQLRNKCSHNWLLNVRIRKGIKRRAPKRPLLQFHGKNLHELGVLGAFIDEYGRLYVRLFMDIY